MAAFHAA